MPETAGPMDTPGKSPDTKIRIPVQSLGDKGDNRIHPGPEHTGQGHACQHQGEPGRPGALRHGEHQDRAEKCPCQSREGGQPPPHLGLWRSRWPQPAPAPGIDSDGAGCCQRICQHPLDNGPRTCQGRPCQKSGAGARQAHIRENPRLHRLLMREDCPHSPRQGKPAPPPGTGLIPPTRTAARKSTARIFLIPPRGTTGPQVSHMPLPIVAFGFRL